MTLKLRTCTCCGDPKPTNQFNWSGKTRRCIPTCKDCGQWLFLFRKVFGPAPRKTPYVPVRKSKLSKPAANLWQTWMGKQA